MNLPVLVVDDDRAVRDALAQTLELEDIPVVSAGSFVEAKDHLTREFEGIVISDIRMPGRDGFHLLDYALKADADLPVILLTGEGDVPMAVRAMADGAFSFLEKPCSPQELVKVVNRARKARALVLENRHMKLQLETGDAASRMLYGNSDLAQGLRRRVRAIAPSSAEVLITGAPGSGVSKVAEVIHLLSRFSGGPFVKVLAASATTESLAAAFAEAERGSLFVDEVAALNPALQVTLLELLDADSGPRVIAGTHRNLLDEMHAGQINSDLFYRLDVMRVRIPALRERPEDIPELFRKYVAIACEQADLPRPEISPDVIARLVAQDWPGNARALMNSAMRFAMGLSELEDDAETGLVQQLARVERSLLIEALRQARGNATDAAAALKLPRKTFYDKLARHAIRPESFR